MASLIFKDRERLSPRYIPEVLPHREGQIKELKDLLWSSLDYPAESYLKTVQIFGDVGTGKTATTLRFGDLFQKEATKRRIDLRHAYLNPKVHGSSRTTLYRHLVQQAAPEAFSISLSAEELLTELVRHLWEAKRYLLISFDEVDYYVRHLKGSVYDLTRLNEISPGRPTGVLGVIFAAKSLKFREKLGREELSTLGAFPIQFPNYTAEQIFDILEERVKEAFQPRAITTDVLEYVAETTVKPPARGDVRYALDLLLYSGNLASNRGSDRVTVEDIRGVVNATHPSITDEDIVNLSDKRKIVLMAVVRSLKGGGSPYASLREIRTMCGVVCEEHGLKPFEDIEEQLQDLADREMIDIKSLTSIGISGLPTETLDRFLDGLIDRIKGGLGAAS